MSIEDAKDEDGVHGGCKGVKLGAGTDSTKALFDSKTCWNHTMHGFHSLDIVFGYNNLYSDPKKCMRIHNHLFDSLSFILLYNEYIQLNNNKKYNNNNKQTFLMLNFFFFILY